MAENEPTGQPVVATAPVTPVEAPAQTVVQPAPQPAVPSGGPTVEELARQLEEQRSYISTLSAEKARAEHDANLFRTLAEQKSRGEGPPTVPEIVEPEITDEEFLRSPVQTFRKIVKAERQAERAEEERGKKAQKQEALRSNFNEGWAKAVQSNKKLYEGIENQVLGQMFKATQDGTIADPNALREPQAWEAMGLLVRYANNERDLGKYFSTSPTPVTAPPTEVPHPSAVPRQSVVLSDYEKQLAKTFGQTEEQYIATKQKVESEE